MAEERNDGLHPRHPGLGKCAVIEIEAVENTPEIGGFMIFLPSGATKTVHWRQPKPITPTIDAAKEYTAKIVESLLKVSERHPDIAATNWTSVCAAVQRVILDWNDKVTGAVNAKMVRDMIEGKTVTSDRRRR